MIDVKTNSEEETAALGAVIGKVLADGDVIALHGDLGAGKTHFVQGIAQGMGITDVIASPTFTILHYYDHTPALQHFDFYRLEQEYELDNLGFDDYLYSGVTVIEWSEKFAGRLPDSAAHITIEKTGPTSRVIHLAFDDKRWQRAENEVKAYVVGD